MTSTKKNPAFPSKDRVPFLSGRKEQARSSAPPLTRSEFEADGAAIGARLAGVARNAARLGDGREDRRQILRTGEVAAPHADVEAVGQADRRSDGRRVGKERVRTGRCRLWPDP